MSEIYFFRVNSTYSCKNWLNFLLIELSHFQKIPPIDIFPSYPASPLPFPFFHPFFLSFLRPSPALFLSFSFIFCLALYVDIGTLLSFLGASDSCPQEPHMLSGRCWICWSPWPRSFLVYQMDHISLSLASESHLRLHFILQTICRLRDSEMKNTGMRKALSNCINQI